MGDFGKRKERKANIEMSRQREAGGKNRRKGRKNEGKKRQTETYRHSGFLCKVL